MIPARRLALYLWALALVAGLVVATGGFSVAEVDRSVDLSVTDDDSAFVGVDVPDEPIEAQDGNETTLFEVTNRFGHDVSVTAEATVDESDGNLSVSDEKEEELNDGETAVSATFECTDGAEGTIGVALEITGDGVEVSLDRQVDVVCESADSAGGLEIRDSEDEDSDDTDEADTEDSDTVEVENEDTEDDDEDSEDATADTEGDDEESDDTDTE